MSIKRIFRFIIHPIKRHNEKLKLSENFHDVEIMPMTLDASISNNVQKLKISKANRHTTIKIVGLICIVGFFFILPTFAQDAQNASGSGTLQEIQNLLQKFLSLCSRGWIVLAILAGKLMTNDFVYGAFMHMDIYLRKIRNIIKNFANFALAGLVLVSIVKGLIGKEALDVKKVITNTLVAGILIQASRFLMGAVVDVSTIATASISAFPMTFFKSDISLQGNITKTIGEFNKNRVHIDLNATGNNVITSIEETNPTDNFNRESILPNQNSISGPFIYLGMGIFNFQNYLTTDITTGIEPLTFGYALRFFFLAVFTIGMLLLLIANIMRIGLLWIFIIGSPFLILMQVFNKKIGDGKGLGNILSLSNFLETVFRPVIFVAGISLMLVVIVSMQKSITGGGMTRENNLNGVSLSVTGSSTSVLAVEGISNISINQTDILGKDVIKKNDFKKAQNFFSHLIILFLALFIMRWFIKLSLTIGKGTIAETMKGLVKNAEGMAQSMPLLPGGAGYTAIQSTLSKNKDKMLGGIGLDKDGHFGEMDGKYFTTNETKFDQRVNNKLQLQEPRTPKDYKELEGLAKDIDASKNASFFGASQSLAQQRNGGLSVNNPQWMSNVNKLLNNKLKLDAVNRSLQNKFDGLWTTGEAKDYFNERNTKALYEAMGGFNASRAPEPKTFEELQNINFYPYK